MPDEVFTYDNIYDILHAEKFISELQSVSSLDLEKIQTYLDNKKKLLDQQEESTQIFSSQKRAMIQIEIDNALRTLKDLYEFREKKIINRAVFSVRGGSIVRDTTNMLEHEVNFYNLLIQIIPDNRTSFFKILESQGSPTVKHVETKISKDTTKDTTHSTKAKTVSLKFLEPVESFTAEDLKSYGPYSTNEEAELPEGIANLLMSQNKAELKKPGEMEDEVPKTGEELLPEVQNTHTSASQTSENQSQTED